MYPTFNRCLIGEEEEGENKDYFISEDILLRKSHCSDGVKGTGSYKTGFIFRL